MSLMDKIKQKAASNPKRIVFPEGEDIRVIQASRQLSEEGLAMPVLLGDKKGIETLCKKEGVDAVKIDIINPLQFKETQAYIDEYGKITRAKSVVIERIKKQMHQSLYCATVMLKIGKVQGLVAGAAHTSAEVIKACLKVIRPAEGVSTVFGFFVMVVPNCSYGEEGCFIFADAGVNPEPNAKQLSDIAFATAAQARSLFNWQPKIAMLSFSTKGSAKHDKVEKVLNAINIVKEKMPDLNIDGELQFDAAYLESVGNKKAPDSPVAGKANVFIFPDLDAGNIGYKIAQRIGGAEAIGPIIQGLRKPYNDLSRGCNVDDIINVACICAIIS